MSKRISTSFRLGEDSMEMLDALVARYQEQMGDMSELGFKFNRTRLIELLIRKEHEDVQEQIEQRN